MKRLLSSTLALVIASTGAMATSFPNHKNTTCQYDLRGRKDQIAFNVDNAGEAYNIKSFARKTLKLDSYEDGLPYINPDGTCGIVNPITHKKDMPHGYRKGKVIHGQFTLTYGNGIQTSTKVELPNGGYN